MRIGIDIRNIGKKRTGDEVVFFNLVKNLALIDEKNEYQLFTDITDKNSLEKIGQDLGIAGKKNFKIMALETANRFSWNFWTLPKYLRKNPVDIYLTQYITPFFVPKKIKVADIIHDISFNFYPQFIKKSDLFFLKTLIPLSLYRADKIIAVSNFTRFEVQKYYGVKLEKIAWIHNAVSEDYLKQDTSPEKLEIVRKKYDLPEKYILYLGTLQPRKNIPTLIEAFSKIKNDNISLVIAGGKGHNFDAKIDEAVKEYDVENKVIFPGFIDEEDKAAVMKLADVFAFPSFYEGFGIPILEAFAVGTPVVASSILPHKEIASDAALYFDPNNSQELAEKISSVLNDEKVRNDLIKEEAEQIKHFSWKKTAEKMLEIFESMK